jgi:hypothetical protein
MVHVHIKRKKLLEHKQIRLIKGNHRVLDTSPPSQVKSSNPQHQVRIIDTIRKKKQKKKKNTRQKGER